MDNLIFCVQQKLGQEIITTVPSIALIECLTRLLDVLYIHKKE
jgi:hypothetical protein